MARPARPSLLRWIGCRTAAALAIIAAVAALGIFANVEPSQAQPRPTIVQFPARPKQPVAPGSGLLGGAKSSKDQMLVRAGEIHYDYTNERVSAVGNVQIYYSGSSLEADKVIYDQKTKRLHAQGNVRLSEPDGKIIYGEMLDLSDGFRDGFVDSLRLEGADATRMAANRAQRTSGNITVFENGVYTACEPCKDDPKKPPKWQVKASRIIHDQGEKMMYFEDARIEFFGVPLAYVPYMSAPDPTAKRKSGFLMPSYSTSSVYGFAVQTPYYFALAPNYDATLTPVFTTKQGPLLQGEWRHRLVDGLYRIRATGIFQLDPGYFTEKGVPTADRVFRGSIESSGQFRLTDKWVYGWDGTLITDRSYFQDYGLYKRIQGADLLASTPDFVVSQAYLQGRGERSFFDIRAMYFYGFSSEDSQRQIPVIHPVMDHDYTFNRPVFGGELSLHSNLTSLSRDAPFFDPINLTAVNNGFCNLGADSSVKTINNCLLRAVPGTYTRLSSDLSWKRTIIDPYGQMFTPFFSVRADVANAQIQNDPGVSNYMTTGSSDLTRVMPTAGLEYRYPFINVQSWGTQTITPIVQVIARPNETGIGLFPNEDSQSFSFDASNLFRVNKFAGWDRVEGGGRLNAGVEYTAQFNRGGFLNVLFGQSYHLFGENSFAFGGPTNTGLQSGLDTNRSDYVARVAFQPNTVFGVTTRFRMNEADFTLQRTEVEVAANFDRWTTSILYGNYAPQPLLGFIDRREGIVGNVKYRVNENWLLLGAVRYDILAEAVTATQIGVGYVDDCLILALNYLTEYNYNGTQTNNHAIMLQLGLRTIGGNTVTTGLSGLTDRLTK